MKEMKFKVESPSHSEAIQNALFKMGYEWMVQGASVNYSDKPFLYAERSGIITYGLSSDVFHKITSCEMYVIDDEIVGVNNNEYYPFVSRNGNAIKPNEDVTSILKSLESILNEYESVLIGGYERITSMGGDCDSVEHMLNSSDVYKEAKTLLQNMEEKYLESNIS